MRPILFKAIRKDNGEWIIGDVGYTEDVKYANIWQRSKELVASHPVVKETVCEFTGQYDSRYKRIFECDNIKVVGSNGTVYEYTVQYIEDGYMCCELGTCGWVDVAGLYTVCANATVTVTGNMHDKK